jgi:hypothetical protein
MDETKLENSHGCRARPRRRLLMPSRDAGLISEESCPPRSVEYRAGLLSRAHGRILASLLFHLAAAEGWYRSADYQKIISLRLSGSIGNVIIVDGHDA